jgi:hypothetical protein
MIIKLIKYPIFLVGLFFIQSTLAYDFQIGLGNMSEYIGEIQTNESGQTNIISFNPYFKANIDFNYYKENFFICPELGTLLPRSPRDSNTSRWPYYGLINAKFKYDQWNFALGAGMYVTRIWGSGGTETLNNGTGTVSYILPDDSTYARNMIINLQLGYQLNPKIEVLAQVYVFNLTSNYDRMISIGLSANYHFGEF